jgi:hypothetical protein
VATGGGDRPDPRRHASPWTASDSTGVSRSVSATALANRFASLEWRTEVETATLPLVQRPRALRPTVRTTAAASDGPARTTRPQKPADPGSVSRRGHIPDEAETCAGVLVRPAAAMIEIGPPAGPARQDAARPPEPGRSPAWRPGRVASARAATGEAAEQDSAGAYPRTGPISGYMDFHFNKPEGQDGILDFHRFVLLFTHSFTPRLRFVAELELEHALVEGLEDKGELELEQAYVDFLLRRGFNIRGGMLLVPVGLINERHEPPVFYGVERPFVDTLIVPSTWFEAGAGVHGELGRGLRYRAYVMAPLDASAFSAEEGLREGRQKGSAANVGRPALTGRIEYLAVRGLALGGSFWSGRSGFAFRPRFDVPVSLVEVDGRHARGRLELRGQYAHVFVGNAASLNDAIRRTTGVDPNVGRQLRGFYVETGYRVVSAARPGDLALFLRYENFDTQFRMPAGFLPLGQFDRSAWVAGFSYWPDPDVVVKADVSIVRNRSAVVRPPRSLNIGLGWWF